MLGVEPIAGRTFTDTRIDWRTGDRHHYGCGSAVWGLPSVVEVDILMNGSLRTIIGVMPKEFVFRSRDVDF